MHNRSTYGPWPVKVAPPCTQNGLSHSWRTLAPDPYNGGVFGTPLAVAVQNELLAFCKPYGRFVPFISAAPPLRVFSAARLSFCIPLLDVPSPRPASPARLHAVHPRQSSDLLCSCALPSAAQAQDRSSGRTGNPCRPHLPGQRCLCKRECDLYAGDEH